MCDQSVNTSLIHVPAVFKYFTVLSNATQSLHNAYFIYMYYIMLIAYLCMLVFSSLSLCKTLSCMLTEIKIDFVASEKRLMNMENGNFHSYDLII